MNVLVDTSIWSLALRRRPHYATGRDDQKINELAELIDETRVVIIGPIRQEILSGISVQSQFELLKKKLRAFDDFPIMTGDYELAAEIFNSCREKGIQGSHIDFLICAVARKNGMAIFTNDQDFENYSIVSNVDLHKPRKFV